MNLKKWVWAVFFLVLVSFPEVYAGQNEEFQLDKEALFQLLDQNKDGRISLDEFQALWKDKNAAKESFRRLDTNNDGYLSSEEFAKPGAILFKW